MPVSTPITDPSLLTEFAAAVLADPALSSALENLEPASTVNVVAPPALRPFVSWGLAATGRTVLAITPTARDGEALTDALGELIGADQVAFYPSWETLPHERLSPRSDTVGKRLAVLRRLCHPGASAHNGPLRVVVAPVRSVLQPQVAGLGDLQPVELLTEQTAVLEEVARELADAAYVRVDLVEKRGEFAVRGGLIDVFPPTEEHPLRVEFWGDEVEQIRSFAVADQRTLEIVDRVWAPPCRELLLTEDVRRRATELVGTHPMLAEMTEQIAQGIAVEGMEALTPVLVDTMEMVVDLFPDDAHLLLVDPERVRTRAADLVSTSEEFLAASWAVAAGGGTAPVDLGAASYRSLDEIRDSVLARGLSWWTLSPFGTGDSGTVGAEDSGSGMSRASRSIELPHTPVPEYRGDVDAAVKDIQAWFHDGYQVLVVHPGAGPAQRMVEMLAEHDVPARLAGPVDHPARGVVSVTTARLDRGFVDPLRRMVLVTGEDLSGQRSSTRDMRSMPARRRKQIDPLELAAGDYIVHEQHGVGRFIEMRQREVGGAVREYLVVEYGAAKRGGPPDRLFVPADALDQVTRYVGGEHPSLDRLGGADWAKRKGRARKAVRQIAAELIKLYAARQATQGYAFGPDTPWQR
ncbi:MAG: CarD family transcriptional regulator, partial [Nocardioides sp.]